MTTDAERGEQSGHPAPIPEPPPVIRTVESFTSRMSRLRLLVVVISYTTYVTGVLNTGMLLGDMSAGLGRSATGSRLLIRGHRRSGRVADCVRRISSAAMP